MAKRISAIAFNRRLWRLPGFSRVWQPCRICRPQKQWLSSSAVCHRGEDGGKGHSIDHELPYGSWSILCNPLSTNPTDDYSTLQSLHLERQLLPFGTIPLVVLLVTQSRIDLVKDDNTFIPSLLSQIFQYPERARAFDVLVAVIDKIPYPEGADPLNGKTSYFWKSSGFEGISVTILRSSETSAPDLWSDREWKKERDTMTIQQRCTLSFLFRPDSEMAAFSTKLPKKPGTLYCFQLPVANTLFHNGQTSTLFAERWDFSPESTSEPRISRTKKVLLPQQALRLTSLAGPLRLKTNLQPITPPRVIAAAMGNIIRQVHPGSGDDSEGTTPASRELEEAISQRINTGQLSAHKSDIWALVNPRETRVTGPRVPSSLQTLFENGSRLHKVLSGGGGWGSKEGLLALDPDSDYSNPGYEMEHDFGGGQNIDKEKSQAFGEIVKAGDAVTFFDLRSVEPKNALQKPLKDRSSWDLRISPSVSLGTSPSQVDEVPDKNWGSIGSGLPFDYVLIRNHFGMLSEHGMSLKIETDCPDNSAYFGAESVGTVVQTKVDAPCTVFSQSRKKLPLEAKRVQLSSDTEQKAVGSEVHGKMIRQPEEYFLLGKLRSISKYSRPPATENASPLTQPPRKTPRTSQELKVQRHETRAKLSSRLNAMSLHQKTHERLDRA